MNVTSVKDVVDELTAKGALDVTPRRSYESFGATIHPIDYRNPPSGNVEPKAITTEIAERGGVFRFRGGIPDLLRERPTVTPPRDFHYSKQDVIDWLVGHGYNLLDEDKISLSRAGNFDRVKGDHILTETVGEGEQAETLEYVTDFHFLVNRDAQGKAIVRQVK